ncbi:MAG: LLM class flavin-dependent oxidoreductase [Candidatus Thorarchaeota archaeon]|jgi:alkanesulfonate monooxygenase SsuD/methylene tetrahydromethanopterin reductase-like flavin-dependent oxidoreductase (luciferase family)
MKFGVRLPNSGPFAVKSSFARIAKECARLDYDIVWVHDHMHWGVEDATHFAAGSAEAVKPGTYQNFFESITTLAYLSNIENIRFGIAALVLPFRNPIAVARQFATLHELTGGRMLLGVCPGGIEHEFERLHLDWKTRGGLTEEHMQVLNLLFSEEPVSSFDGEYVKFSNVEFFPKPKDLPMWYGAHPSTRTARRVAKYCDGWIPSYLTCAQFEKTIAKIRKFAVEFDRNPDDIDICHETYICISKTREEAEKISRRTMKEIFPDENYEKAFLIGSPDDITEKLKKYEKSGLTDFEIKFLSHNVDQMLDMIELFSNEVKPIFS